MVIMAGCLSAAVIVDRSRKLGSEARAWLAGYGKVPGIATSELEPVQAPAVSAPPALLRCQGRWWCLSPS